MKLFFFKLFLFIGITLSTLLTLEKFDNYAPSYDGNVVRLRNSLNHDSLDYLFIGPSYNYCSIKPSLLDSHNIKSYNLGIATAGVYYYSMILNDYLKSVRVKPKNIVFSFSLITFSDIASDNWDNYPIHRYLKEPLSNEAACLKYGAYNRYPIMLKNSLRKSINYFWEPKKKWGPEIYDSIITLKDSLKGYDYRPVTFFTDSLYNIDKEKYASFFYDEFSLKRKNDFYELIEKTEKLGIHVILLESPTFRVKDFFSDSFKEEYQKFKQELITKHLSVISIQNMDDRRLYSNIDHCNDLGAEKFSRSLIKELGL